VKKSVLRAAPLVLALLSLLTVIVSSVSAQSAPITIDMGERGNEYFFEPQALSVPAGQVRINFNNVGQRNHNWVVTLPSGVQRTPDIGGGRTAEQAFTFAQPGTFEVICDLPTHAQRGMRMVLTVTAAAGGTATGGTATGTGAQGQATVSAGGSVGGTSTGTSSGTGATAGSVPGSTTGTASPAGTPYLVSLMVHIPAAIAWLGIVLFDAIVVAVPFLTPGQRGALLARPRWLVLLTIPLFAVTGIYQTIFNPFGTITSYADLTALRSNTTYGLALYLKHGFVFASMVLTLAVTFWFAPRLIAFAGDTTAETVTPSRLPSLLTWANVAACIALLACVAVMVFQLH